MNKRKENQATATTKTTEITKVKTTIRTPIIKTSTDKYTEPK